MRVSKREIYNRKRKKVQERERERGEERKMVREREIMRVEGGGGFIQPMKCQAWSIARRCFISLFTL